MTIAFAAAFVAFGMGLFATAAVWNRARHPVLEKADAPDVTGAQPAGSFAYRALEPLLLAAGRALKRISPARRSELIARRIVQSGRDGLLTADRVMSYKAMCAIGFGLVAFVGAPAGGTRLLWSLGTAFAASFVPDIVLDARARARQSEIARDLPEALDLMAIAVEAGVGLEAAFDLVRTKLQGPLASELNRLLREIELGLSRHDALTRLRERTSVPEVSAFVAALIQADQVGAPVSEVLRVQADQARQRRRARARERAAKTPVKILFPVVFCIFPALFVVTIGPGAINIMRTLLR